MWEFSFSDFLVFSFYDEEHCGLVSDFDCEVLVSHNCLTKSRP